MLCMRTAWGLVKARFYVMGVTQPQHCLHVFGPEGACLLWRSLPRPSTWSELNCSGCILVCSSMWPAFACSLTICQLKQRQIAGAFFLSNCRAGHDPAITLHLLLHRHPAQDFLSKPSSAIHSFRRSRPLWILISLQYTTAGVRGWSRQGASAAHTSAPFRCGAPDSEHISAGCDQHQGIPGSDVRVGIETFSERARGDMGCLCHNSASTIAMVIKSSVASMPCMSCCPPG